MFPISERKTLLIMSKQLQIDQEELKAMKQDQKKFLVKAITSYIECFKRTDTHDLRVFRLISLWFENLKEDEINKIMMVISHFHVY